MKEIILSIQKLPAVKSRTGLSKNSIYNGVNEGTFPKPVKIGIRGVGWYTHEISEWLGSLERSDIGQKISNGANHDNDENLNMLNAIKNRIQAEDGII